MEQVKAKETLENRRGLRVGLASTAVLVVLSGLALAAGLWKLLAIAWVAFIAMMGAAPFGARASARAHARRLVWGYGLASGAMITSASLFLVPSAIGHDAAVGGLGLALGVIAGFAIHTAGHQLTHTHLLLDHTTTELAVHALAAGSIIGLVYAAMPELGPLLGLAIVSHKGPAGYAAARRLRGAGRPASVLLLPASAVGLAALPVGLLDVPEVAWVNALVFGFATGVFLHVAMDFLPRCELGGEIYEAAQLSGGDHALLDRLRLQAVLSTALGGAAVLAAWLLLRG